MITIPECPYCGKWYRSNKSLKQHITKTHTMDTPMGRVVNPVTFDFVGGFIRKVERRKRRKR